MSTMQILYWHILKDNKLDNQFNYWAVHAVAQRKQAQRDNQMKKALINMKNEAMICDVKK